VGTTAVQATVDYPYSRLHQAFQSNTDVKTWWWGGLVLGADTHYYADQTPSVGAATRMVLSAGTWIGTPTGDAPNQSAASADKVVWVWACDRDGLATGVLGAKVTWALTPTFAGGGTISDRTCLPPGDGISEYNEITKQIYLRTGFLEGTNGVVTDGTTALHGVSYLRAPTAVEKILFNKFWGTGYTDPVSHVSYNATSSSIAALGLNAANFCVAAIDLKDNSGSQTNPTGRVSVLIDIYTNDIETIVPAPAVPNKYIEYSTNVDFHALDSLDDAMRPGDANYDGVVNMGDVTAVERMILGYQTVAQNAILNSEGTIDMGTVVKIERMILGLK